MGDDGDDTWDAGLNKGLVWRPAVQKKPPDSTPEAEKKKKGWYKGSARPEYYAESNPAIPYAKAVLYAVIAVVPYFTILDTLGHNKDFVPCNDMTCHYMRIFNSKSIPATGVNVMGVKNGISRPVALHYYTFDAYSCPSAATDLVLSGNRSMYEKTVGEQGSSCPVVGHKDYSSFLERHDATAEKVEGETDFANKFTWSVKMSFYLTKGPLWLFSYPMNLIAKTSRFWGMENIPPALCPGKTYDQMQEICTNINTENKKRGTKHSDLIENHLMPYTPAKLFLVAGLAGYAVFTIIHDVMLLAEYDEFWSLTMGFCATFCYGIAGCSVFFWAMGAAEVFVAKAMPEHSIQTCACFYQIPEMSALVALATPFAVFAGFMARVQMQGLAALFGDFLAYQTYYIPHYLGRQSFLWTWAVLCSPKLCGTKKGKPRQDMTKNWPALSIMQTVLFWLAVFNQFVLALCASAFMIAFKELCTNLYIEGMMTPMCNLFIKYVLLPAPSVVTVVVGIIAAIDLKSITVSLDEGESFGGQVRTVMPFLKYCTGKSHLGGADGKLKQRSYIDWFMGVVFFLVGEVAIIVWTIAVAQGLCPDWQFLFGNQELTKPKLVQAEVWGACGFIFFFVHIPRLMSIGFSTWEDLESMKHLKEHQTLGNWPPPEMEDYKKVADAETPLVGGDKES